MKIIFTSPILEHPAAGGPQLRIENSILALKNICELHIISRSNLKYLGGLESENFYRQSCHSFCYAPSAQSNLTSLGFRITNKLIRAANKGLFKISNRNLLLDKQFLRIQEDAKFLIDYARQHQISIIWFGYGNISYLLMKLVKQIAPDIKLVCDTDSVWSRFILRELPYQKDPIRYDELKREGEEKQKEEKEWVEFCDITTAVSSIDQSYYQSLTSHPEKIRIFSNVINLNTYSNIPPAVENFHENSIYLAGSFGPGSAMDQAARWLINEVWPILHQASPDLYFYIVGRGSDTTLQDIQDSHIIITGQLRSVLPYLGHVRVSTVPLKFESGTRFKILEAGACGIPVVSTTLGAEGIPVTHNEDILIADSPQDFAKAILDILQNPELASKLSYNLKKLVEKNYSLETLSKEGQSILNLLVSENL